MYKVILSFKGTCIQYTYGNVVQDLMHNQSVNNLFSIVNQMKSVILGVKAKRIAFLMKHIASMNKLCRSISCGVL